MSAKSFVRYLFLLQIVGYHFIECNRELHAKFDLFLRLRRAVEERDKSTVSKLLQRGANPNIEIQYVSSLVMPSKRGEESVAEPFNLMGIAVRSSTEAILRRLLVAGGNASAVIDRDGLRPIHVAIDRGHLGMIKALILRGADVNVMYDGNSLLHHAISVHEVDVIELLIIHGADPLVKNENGKDCLEASREAWCRGCEMILLKMMT